MVDKACYTIKKDPRNDRDDEGGPSFFLTSEIAEKLTICLKGEKE